MYKDMGLEMDLSYSFTIIKTTFSVQVFWKLPLFATLLEFNLNIFSHLF